MSLSAKEKEKLKLEKEKLKAKARKANPQPLAIVLLWLFWLSMTAIYALDQDITYAITIWPAWLWAFLGMLTVLIKPRKGSFKRRRIVLLAWVAFALYFSDPSAALARSAYVAVMKPQPVTKGDFRVVSLNCAGGDPAAAAEVKQYEPDIVLLQECPKEDALKKLSGELFGKEAAFVVGPDCAILARGKLTPLELPPKTTNFTAATLQTPKGTSLLIVSLRLKPPVLRFDYWNPECWYAYADERQFRATELGEIERWIHRNKKNQAVILGGDFNSPPSRKISAVLTEDYKDTYRASGKGWGGTVINEYPFVRVDQIWCSLALNAHNCYAKKTEHSDHRMVIAELNVLNGMKTP